ncbi:MAG: hypothetical protein Q9227_000514 [Pyrenula ochraceoflavens]
MGENESSTNKTLSLSGRNDYHKWSRYFNGKAMWKQLWGFYTGEEDVVTKPIFTDYVPEHLTNLTQVAVSSCMKQYDIALNKYKSYKKNNAKAGGFLLENVNQEIAEKLDSRIDMDDPAAAWEWLRTTYGQVELERCLTLSLLGRALHSTTRKLKDAQVQIDDVFAMGKVINGLPKRFYPWVDRYYQDLKAPNYDDTLENMMYRLTIENAKLEARWEREKFRKAETKKEKKMEKDRNADQSTKPAEQSAKKGGRQRSEKECSICKKPGHIEEKCWFNPDNANNKLSKNPPNSDAKKTVKKEFALGIYGDVSVFERELAHARLRKSTGKVVDC